MFTLTEANYTQSLVGYFRFDFFEDLRLSSFLCAASNSSSEGSGILLPPYFETRDENIDSNRSFLSCRRCDMIA